MAENIDSGWLYKRMKSTQISQCFHEDWIRASLRDDRPREELKKSAGLVDKWSISEYQELPEAEFDKLRKIGKSEDFIKDLKKESTTYVAENNWWDAKFKFKTKIDAEEFIESVSKMISARGIFN